MDLIDVPRMPPAAQVMLLGQGAQAILAVLIERLWRESNPQSGQVTSLVPGGDVGLIQAMPEIESHADLAVRQLKQRGFNDNTWVISLSKTQTSPFISSVVSHANNAFHHAPWLVGDLGLDNAALLLLVGHTLLSAAPYQRFVAKAKNALSMLSIDMLSPLSFQGAQNNSFVVAAPFALDFLLASHHLAPNMQLPAAKTPLDAWQQLLKRPPRVLNWPELPCTSNNTLLQYNFATQNTKGTLVAIRYKAHHLTWKIDHTLGKWRLMTDKIISHYCAGALFNAYFANKKTVAINSVYEVS